MLLLDAWLYLPGRMMAVSLSAEAVAWWCLWRSLAGAVCLPAALHPPSPRQLRRSRRSGQEVPPLLAGRVTVRVRVAVPGPHWESQLLHSLHSDTAQSNTAQTHASLPHIM